MRGENMESGPRRVATLEVWQEGMTIVEAVYSLTGDWPRTEIYGLTSQARRAAVSIPANLSEGVGRGTPAEMARFAKIALGSAYELHTLMALSARLGFSKADEINALLSSIEQLNRRMSRFIQFQESRK